MPSVSVVLPVLNEIRHSMLSSILNNLSGIDELEVIIVDGGSSDGTLQLIAEHRHFRLLQLSQSHRAARIELGLKEAKGQVLFIHHPRSLPDSRVFNWLIENQSLVTWGGLTHAFDTSHPLLQFTSWYSNHMRGDLKNIFYLDHCLYINRTLWPNERQFPQEEIFEDTLFSLQLRKMTRAQRLPFASVTSSARFQKNGLWRQATLLQWTKVAFLLGMSPQRINRIYERGLQFNNLASETKK